MPIYEYRCQNCGAEFGDLVRMGTPDEDVECPKCSEHQSKRMLSVFSSPSSGGGSSALSSIGSSACGGGSGFS